MLPCLTEPFYSPVSDILTIAKAISDVCFPTSSITLYLCGESNFKAQKLWASVAAVLSGELGSWILEIGRLLCCDLCSVPLLAVDKVLAAADELGAYFKGYFVFACRITKRQQLEWKLEAPGLRMKVMQRQNRWWRDGEAFGMALHNFWCALLLFFNADINCLPGSAASGRSSCNNMAVTELWRVYDLVPAVKWWGLLKDMWVKPDYMIAMGVYKLTIFSRNGKNDYVCMWYWLLCFCFTQNSWRCIFFYYHILVALWVRWYTFQSAQNRMALHGCSGSKKVFYWQMT